jgi:CheY-like chemotaxis protein
MKKVLILEQDKETAETIDRLLKVFHITAEVTPSHPAAIQSYSSNELMAIFMDVEMPTISVHGMLADFDDISKTKGQKRPPIIFLCSKSEVVQQLHLKTIPGSVVLEKPVSIANLHRILDALKVVSFHFDSFEVIEGKISHFSDFLVASRSWLQQVGKSLNKL